MCSLTLPLSPCLTLGRLATLDGLQPHTLRDTAKLLDLLVLTLLGEVLTGLPIGPLQKLDGLFYVGIDFLVYPLLEIT